jgi:spore germination protein
MTVYIVRPGDSVYKIAQQFHVTPAALVAANALASPDLLLVGQALLIPSPRTHTVTSGESLYSIAQRYGATVAQLMLANPQITNPNMIRPGLVLQLPREQWGKIIVNGYAYPNARPQVLAESLGALSFLSVFASYAGADGSLTSMNDKAIIAQVKAAGVSPHLVVANMAEGTGFQSSIAAELLANPQRQELLLQNAVKLMKEKGYTGLDLDFEYVPAAYREAYNCFLAKARAWMHDEGFILTAAIPPKTRDNQSGLLTEGFDYSAHGKYDDYVTLMTYEWGYQEGPPMAVAPINEVRKVLDYAITRIPQEKILLGIPNYGYDWKTPYVQGSRATVYSNPGAIELAARYHAAINYDETAQTPWFRYVDENGQGHEVWFEDARSIRAKLDLARQFGLGGISEWTVNLSFPQNWNLVKEHFEVRKSK